MHGFPRGPYHEPYPQPNLHAHGVGNSGHGGPASSSSLGCKINPVLVPGKGYLVLHVHPGSFSERNGVRPGDYVIGVNGVNLKSPLSRFVATASLVLNGLRGQLTFERPSGQRYDVVMR
ncbi:PDZ domain-containing protein [Stieleria neptunia]|nr:PDZ domain-containing protein [Stieleria neptunia]